MPSANNVEQTELTRQGLQGSQKEILSKHLLHCLDTLWLTQPFSSTVFEIIVQFFADHIFLHFKCSVCGICCFMGIVFRRIFYYTLYSIIPEEKVEKV
jgi:hypothetical protein